MRKNKTKKARALTRLHFPQQMMKIRINKNSKQKFKYMKGDDFDA